MKLRWVTAGGFLAAVTAGLTALALSQGAQSAPTGFSFHGVWMDGTCASTATQATLYGSKGETLGTTDLTRAPDQDSQGQCAMAFEFANVKDEPQYAVYINGSLWPNISNRYAHEGVYLN